MSSTSRVNSPWYEAAAVAYAQTVANHIKAARFDGITSLAGCADYLNRHGVKTRRGAAFAPMTVKRLAARLGITFQDARN